jgi:hypothetical protein
MLFGSLFQSLLSGLGTNFLNSLLQVFSSLANSILPGLFGGA